MNWIFVYPLPNLCVEPLIAVVSLPPRLETDRQPQEVTVHYSRDLISETQLQQLLARKAELQLTNSCSFSVEEARIKNSRPTPSSPILLSVPLRVWPHSRSKYWRKIPSPFQQGEGERDHFERDQSILIKDCPQEKLVNWGLIAGYLQSQADLGKGKYPTSVSSSFSCGSFSWPTLAILSHSRKEQKHMEGHSPEAGICFLKDWNLIKGP